MRRRILAAVFVLGFVCAGGSAAVAGTVAAPTPQPVPQPPGAIAAGVHIGRVAVGGLTARAASDKVSREFTRPLVLVAGNDWFRVRPWKLGARAYIKTAVARAQSAAPGAQVPLSVAVNGTVLRTYAAGLRKRFARRAVDATLSLRGLRPWISPDRPGRAVDTLTALPKMVHALKTGERAAIRIHLTAVPARVTSSGYGAIIVIHRGSNQLYLYDGMHLWRTFGVATGQAAYPTPLGAFSIAVMWRNPWWYPPATPWAQGAKPIPPGPGNPLGTRWMGLTAPGVGIHGTPDPASIGYSASHGCIRMRIPEAEWLFEHVSIGTPVFIVSA